MGGLQTKFFYHLLFLSMTAIQDIMFLTTKTLIKNGERMTISTSFGLKFKGDFLSMLPLRNNIANYSSK